MSDSNWQNYFSHLNTRTIPNRVLRLRQVLQIVGLSKSTVYARIREGSSPKSISLGGMSVGWIESEVNDWVSARISVSASPCTDSLH